MPRVKEPETITIALWESNIIQDMLENVDDKLLVRTGRVDLTKSDVIDVEKLPSSDEFAKYLKQQTLNELRDGDELVAIDGKELETPAQSLIQQLLNDSVHFLTFRRAKVGTKGVTPDTKHPEKAIGASPDSTNDGGNGVLPKHSDDIPSAVVVESDDAAIAAALADESRRGRPMRSTAIRANALVRACLDDKNHITLTPTNAEAKRKSGVHALEAAHKASTPATHAPSTRGRGRGGRSRYPMISDADVAVAVDEVDVVATAPVVISDEPDIVMSVPTQTEIAEIIQSAGTTVATNANAASLPSDLDSKAPAILEITEVPRDDAAVKQVTRSSEAVIIPDDGIVMEVVPSVSGRKRGRQSSNTSTTAKKPRLKASQSTSSQPEIVDLAADSDGDVVASAASVPTAVCLRKHGCVKAGVYGYGHIDYIQTVRGTCTYVVKLWWGGTLYCTEQWLVQHNGPQNVDNVPIGTAFNISYTLADVYRLTPGVYLNDTIIDIALAKHAASVRSKAIEYAGTYTLPLLERDGKAEAQAAKKGAAADEQKKRASGNIDPFTKAFTLFPFNDKKHWSLAVLCYPAMLLPGGASATAPASTQEAIDSRPSASMDIDDLERSVSAASAEGGAAADDAAAIAHEDSSVAALRISLETNGEETTDPLQAGLSKLKKLILSLREMTSFFVSKQQLECLCAVLDSSKHASDCTEIMEKYNANCLNAVTGQEHVAEQLVFEAIQPDYDKVLKIHRCASMSKVIATVSVKAKDVDAQAERAAESLAAVERSISAYSVDGVSALQTAESYWRDIDPAASVAERIATCKENTMNFSQHLVHQQSRRLGDPEYEKLLIERRKHEENEASLRLRRCEMLVNLHNCRVRASKNATKVVQALLKTFDEQYKKLDSLLYQRLRSVDPAALSDSVSWRKETQALYHLGQIFQGGLHACSSLLDGLKESINGLSALVRELQKDRKEYSTTSKSAAKKIQLIPKELDKARSRLSQPPKPCIIFFDSLNAHRLQDVTRPIRAFLERTYNDRYNDGSSPPLDVTADTLPAVQPKDIPRQDNHCDCGVFVIEYLRHFGDPSFPHITQADINTFFRDHFSSEWFDQGSVPRVREQLLRDLLNRSYTEGKAARSSEA